MTKKTSIIVASLLVTSSMVPCDSHRNRTDNKNEYLYHVDWKGRGKWLEEKNTNGLFKHRRWDDSVTKKWTAYNTAKSRYDKKKNDVITDVLEVFTSQPKLYADLNKYSGKDFVDDSSAALNATNAIKTQYDPWFAVLDIYNEFKNLKQKLKEKGIAFSIDKSNSTPSSNQQSAVQSPTVRKKKNRPSLGFQKHRKHSH